MRRRKVAGLLAAAAAGVLLVGLDALVIEPHLRLGVSVADLPRGWGGRLAGALGGARVVHLSDMHVRGMGFRERRLVALLGDLDADLLLMTGDYGEGPRGFEALARLLGTARPRLGAYGVLGNNDHFRGERDEIVATLEKAGVRVLINEHVVVEGPGGRVAIVGVDDPHFGRDDIEAAMAGIEEEMPVILLAHATDLLGRGRSRGLLVNAGDAEGPWGRGIFWQDGSHMRDDVGEVAFPTTGRRRVRVQRREDGVSVGEIRLVPVTREPVRAGGSHKVPPEGAPGEIRIRPEDVSDQDLHGGWIRTRYKGVEVLSDLPDRGWKEGYASVAPVSYFEAEFEASAGVRYHVWVRVVSPNGRGTSDSLYVQFTDSVGPDGAPAYRIGEPRFELRKERVDLMLAGHTHGGQVVLPFLGPLEPNIRREGRDHGMYRVEGMPLYVSRGIGWSYLPVRFWCPPEVVLFAGAS